MMTNIFAVLRPARCFNSKQARCPITHLIMACPVDNTVCNTYEQEAIEKWFGNNSTDPLTMKPLSEKTLRANMTLKRIIDDFLSKNTDLIAINEVYFAKNLHEQIRKLIMENNICGLRAKLSTLIDYRYVIKNFDDQSEYSAFYLSTESGSVEISKLIFDFIFDKKLLSMLNESPSNWKPTYLNDLIHFYKNRHDTVHKGKYLEEKFNSFIVSNDNFSTPNEILRIKGKKNILKYVANNSHVIEEENSLVLEAAIYNNEDLFEILVSPKNVDSIDSMGLNCFYYAIKNQNLKIINLIMQNRQYNSHDCSPLKIATELYPNNFNLYDKIIELHPSYLNKTDFKKRTLLFDACEKSNIDLVDFLLNKPGMQINHLDSNLENCLHPAVKMGKIKIISNLIRHGVNINQKNYRSKSPFDLAGKRIKRFILFELQISLCSANKDINYLNNQIEILKKDLKQNSSIIEKFKDNACLVAIGNTLGKVYLVNLLTEEIRLKLNAHQAAVHDLKFSSDGFLFSCSADNTIKQWDLDTSSCVKTFTDKDNNPYLIESYNHDILISIGKDNMVKKWNLTSSKCVASLAGHTKQINCIKTIKNFLITASSDLTIRIWDLNSENCEKILHGHQNAVNFVHSIDNLTLISASSDRMIKFWDLNSFTNTASFKSNIGPFDFDILLKNADIVDQKSIFYSSDLNLYEFKLNCTTNSLRSFSGHSNEIIKIKCFKNSKRLLSVSVDGQVKFWNLSSFRCLKTIQIEDLESALQCFELMPNLS